MAELLENLEAVSAACDDADGERDFLLCLGSGCDWFGSLLSAAASAFESSGEFQKMEEENLKLMRGDDLKAYKMTLNRMGREDERTKAILQGFRDWSAGLFSSVGL